MWLRSEICLTLSEPHGFSCQLLGIWQCFSELLGAKHMCLSLSDNCQRSVISLPSSLYSVLLWTARRHSGAKRPAPTSAVKGTLTRNRVQWWQWSWLLQKDAFSKKFRIKCQASSQRCAHASWKPSSSLCLIRASECSNMFMRVTHAGAAPELPSSIVPASGWLAWLPP